MSDRRLPRVARVTTPVPDESAPYTSTYDESDSGDSDSDSDNQGVKLDYSDFLFPAQAQSMVTEEEEEDAKVESPKVERYTPPFVRNGQRASSDQVLAKSPSSKGSEQTGHSSKLPRGADVENWRSGVSSKDSNGSAHTSSPRARDLIEAMEIENRFSNQSAQGIYPPSSCVFVANLLQSESEMALEMAVTQAFRGYGSVYVKIRRDPKQMPFAFCQFTRQEDAENAIRYGTGNLIFGRPCRCEKAKAHRLFMIHSRYGPRLTVVKARELMQGFGELENVYTPSDVQLATLDIPDSIFVQFFLYDDGQNAFNAFRNHPEYKMESLSKNENSKKAARGGQVDNAEQYLARYDVDRRSIFVGNLPRTVTEGQLSDLFSGYGRIKHVSIHTRPSRVEMDEDYAFAFVEFESPTALHRAIGGTHGRVFGTKVLRVHPKDSESSRNRRRGDAPGRGRYSDAPRSHPRSTPFSALPVRTSSQMPAQTFPSAPTYAVAYPPMSPMAPPVTYGYPTPAPWFDGHQWYPAPAWTQGGSNGYGAPYYAYGHSFAPQHPPPGYYQAPSPPTTDNEATEGSATPTPEGEMGARVESE